MVYSITRTSPVLFGVGAIEQIGSKAKELGCQKVLFVTDEGIKKAGIADGVINSLNVAGVDFVQYDRIPSDAPDYAVEEGAELAKKEGVEGIVAVGGGSVLDAAKGINNLFNNPSPITAYYGVNVAKNPGKVLILAPTTSGTGSEVTAIAVITNSKTNKKSGVIGVNSTATLAVVDPALTLKLPPLLTAATGMDAFSHAIEALTTALANPFSDILAAKAVELIYNYLPVAVENGSDIEARTNMSLASMIAGIAFNDALPHLGHAVAHTLGAFFHIHHGTMCALITPEVIEWVADAAPEKIKIIGKAMGLKIAEEKPIQETAKEVADAVRVFNKKIGIPDKKELGVDPSRLNDIAPEVLKDDTAAFVPKKIEAEEVANILHKAFGA